MQKTDVGTGIGLMGLGVWFFTYSAKYADKAIFFYGPNFFPQFLAVAMAICAGILIFKGVKGLNQEPCDKIHFKGFLRMLVAIAMCIGYLLVMQYLGFAISTAIFLFALMTYLEHKGVLKRALASVSVSLIVWSIFQFFLVIPVPTGVFSFTF